MTRHDMNRRVRENLSVVTKLGDKCDASVYRQAKCGDGVRFRGRYDVSCREPATVINPAKVKGLLGRHVEPFQRQWSAFIKPNDRIPSCHFDGILSRGILPYSAINRLRRTIGRTCSDLYHEVVGLCRFGGLKWSNDFGNLVVNEGLDHALDIVLSGGTQDTTWFVGLLAASPTPLAAWTATEIASNDFVDYSESNLQAFTDGGVSSQSLDNSGSTADFSIDTNSSSIGGAYLIATNAKATPSGTLFSAAAFSGGNKAADSGDTLSVTYTFTAADDGA